MLDASAFEPLSIETLPRRLGGLKELTERVGDNASKWDVAEIGDGNLNLVFIVHGEKGSAIVKQALPYVRLVGEKWPLPLKRSFFEYHALRRQAKSAPGMTPDVFFFDESQALIIMRYLSPHVILRKALVEGQQFQNVGKELGNFLAKTLFLSSDFHMTAAERKRDMALFAENSELCDITESLVFSDPYFDAELNRHTSPQLDSIAAELRADSLLKIEVQKMKHLFVTSAEAMLHGDLHTGSIMVTEDETVVIDPEFAFYGPMAFDIGILLANFWMAFFSQAGHESGNDREAMRQYLLKTVSETWAEFANQFSILWQTQRTGILYQKALFEDQGDLSGSKAGLRDHLEKIWIDSLGFAGIEMHRRILGLAHNADFERIAGQDVKARCEMKALIFGRALIRDRTRISTADDANSLAAMIEKEAENEGR